MLTAKLLNKLVLVTIFLLLLLTMPIVRKQNLIYAQTTPTTNTGTPATNANYTPDIHTGFTLENVLSTAAGCWPSGLPLAGGAGCTQRDANGNLIIYKPVYDANGKLINKVPGGGALGGVSKIMVALYSYPPTSTKEYLAYVGTNLGIVKPAYAQGVGGSGDGVLKPILDLWRVMRNVAYLAFILVFLVVGLMIMFRRKLNPQTVISVQAALPGLIIGLVLVTFSYFIAALIVDLSFVGMKLVAFIFQQSGLTNIIAEGTAGFSPAALTGNTQGPTSLATNGNIFNLYTSFIANDALRANVVAPIVNAMAAPAQWLGRSFVAVTSVGTLPFIDAVFQVNTTALLGNIIGSAVATVLGGGVGLLISAIIMIALLIQMLRLLWGLVSAYITIMVFAIAGPLLIAIGSIPGRGSAITYWWKMLLANVLIFPAVFFVFLFAGMFLANAGSFTNALPLFAGLPTNVLGAIIGYGLVLGSPAVPGMVKEALGVKDITAITQAAFAGFAAGVAVPRAGVQTGLINPIRARREAFLRAERDKIWSGTVAGGASGRKGFRDFLTTFWNKT